MKTKTYSNNRVTRSHTSRSQEAVALGNRAGVKSSSNAVVSKRDDGAIMRQVRQIRDSWTKAERDERAQLGAQRRAELCALLFGAN